MLKSNKESTQTVNHPRMLTGRYLSSCCLGATPATENGQISCPSKTPGPSHPTSCPTPTEHDANGAQQRASVPKVESTSVKRQFIGGRKLQMNQCVTTGAYTLPGTGNRKHTSQTDKQPREEVTSDNFYTVKKKASRLRHSLIF